MKITVNLRTGDGGHVNKKPFTYKLTLNGKPIEMKPRYDDVRMTFDSFQGWQIWMGNWSTIKPVRIKNGDVLRITADQDWSAISGITISVGE
jgi:hypothetical protein